jgi:hypothetical protein
MKLQVAFLGETCVAKVLIKSEESEVIDSVLDHLFKE